MSKVHEIGRVYAIRSFQTDKIYIGSTFQPLHKRLYEHKFNYKQWQNNKYYYITSFELIKYDDCYIELIDEYKNLNKKQLEKFEGEHIRKNNCTNRSIPGRTKKEYYQDNMNKIKEQRNNYYLEKSDEVKKRASEYRQNNADKIKEKYSQKHGCVCGGKYTHFQKARHERTKKHLDFINKK
jgi:hypothetical protein